MNLLLCFAITYLLYTSIILFRNSLELKALNDSKSSQLFEKKVSVCIPARNEEKGIQKCVISILNQSYQNLEVLVLDDESIDDTFEILTSISNQSEKLKIIKGSPKPSDWLGKPWACHQLSLQATSDILIYIDADVWLEKNAVSKAVTELKTFDTITIWPQQELFSFWEKQAIPLIYFALFTLLPAKYVERSPKWLPHFLRKKLSPKFAAACGQFLAFNRSAYLKTGGHESVKAEIVEDVALAKGIKANELTLKMLHGINSVYCRMYSSNLELWNGLRKNFFEGFNRNIFSFGIMALLHVIVFVLPFITFIYGFSTNDSSLIILSSVALIITFIQRALLNYLMRWDIYSAFTHIVGVLWFQALGIRCVRDYLLNKKVTWKDRSL